MSCTSAPSSNGFARKPKAPASSAVWRTNGSSRPVMKMIRVAGEFSMTQACTSKPFMTGIHHVDDCHLTYCLFEPGEKGDWMVKLFHTKTRRLHRTPKRPQQRSVVVKEPEGSAAIDL